MLRRLLRGLRRRRWFIATDPPGPIQIRYPDGRTRWVTAVGNRPVDAQTYATIHDFPIKFENCHFYKDDKGAWTFHGGPPNPGENP